MLVWKRALEVRLQACWEAPRCCAACEWNSNGLGFRVFRVATKLLLGLVLVVLKKLENITNLDFTIAVTGPSQLGLHQPMIKACGHQLTLLS